jgi:hypothetical protein
MALGAQPTDVLWLIFGQASRLVVVDVLIGVVRYSSRG